MCWACLVMVILMDLKDMHNLQLQMDFQLLEIQISITLPKITVKIVHFLKILLKESMESGIRLRIFRTFKHPPIRLCQQLIIATMPHTALLCIGFRTISRIILKVIDGIQNLANWVMQWIAPSQMKIIAHGRELVNLLMTLIKSGMNTVASAEIYIMSRVQVHAINNL